LKNSCRTTFWIVILSLLVVSANCFAIDSPDTRRTLVGIKNVHVIVEELQPNLQKYAKKQDLSREQVQRQVENQLKAAGVGVLNREEWLQTPGRPVLYVNVNTHEFEKYRFAYNVSVELRQIVSLESNPAINALAPTWSTNMTGVVNMGTANIISDQVRQLVRSFTVARFSSNHP
jgi:hypothetical protein